MRRKQSVQVIVPVLALVGTCFGQQTPAPRGSAPVVKSAQEVKPNVAKSEFRIGPGDVLDVKVWNEAAFNAAGVLVRPDGMISLNMLGDMQAAGLTVQELQEQVQAKYRQSLIKEAMVNVSLTANNSQVAHLLGEVRKEGPVKLTKPTTVLQAVAEAGGLSEFAKRKAIVIIRGTQRLQFDWDAVISGRQPDILLHPDDKIYVPR